MTDCESGHAEVSWAPSASSSLSSTDDPVSSGVTHEKSISMGGASEVATNSTVGSDMSM